VVEVKVGAGQEHETVGRAVMPAAVSDPLPVVVYLHGSGGSLERDGRALRLLADEGFAAVGLEYEKRDYRKFKLQMDELLDWIEKQRWARREAVVWLGFSLGAQSFLRYLVHSGRSPAVLIRAAGGKLGEGPERLRKGLPVWMVHGEKDQVFALEDVKALAEELRRLGAEVRLDVLPGRPHGFRDDRGVVLKLLAGRLKRHFGVEDRR